MKLQAKGQTRQISARARKSAASQLQSQSRSDKNVHQVSWRSLDRALPPEYLEQLRLGTQTPTQADAEQWTLQDEEDLIEL